MSGISRLFLRCAFLLLAMLLASCGPAAPPHLTATIDETGLHVAIDPPSTLTRLTLEQGAIPVQTWEQLPVSSRLDLPVPMTPGAGYTLRATWQKQDLPVLELRAPEASATPLRIVISRIGDATPLVLLPPDDTIPLVMALPPGDNKLLLDVDLATPTPGVATLIYPAALLPEPQGDRSQVRRIPFELQGQRYTETFPVRLRGTPQELRLVVQFEANGVPGLREWERIVTLVPLDVAALQGSLTLDEVRLPAPPPGTPPSPVMESAIRLPDATWERVGSLFGIPARQIHADSPYAMAQLRLTNHGEVPLPIICALDVRETGIDISAASFQPAGWLATGGADAPQVVRHVMLPPGSAEVLLPLYVRPTVRPGTYHLVLTAHLAGSELPLFIHTQDLAVTRPGSLVSLTLLAMCLLTVLTGAALALTWQRLLASTDAGTLMSLALLAALLAGGGLTIGAANLVLAAVLGPFNVFVGEMAGEVWTAGIITIAIRLRPRPGTFTLLYLTQALLRGILAGQLQILDLLIYGTAIGLTELLLWVSGVTVGAAAKSRFSLTFGLRLILALALADAVGTWVQLAIGMGLYRLQYAEWYLVATVLITGFGFTLLGAAGALPLSRELRRTHG
ncbi:MAG: hypothetical protein GEEBNDBF_00924 [bacterium]|nr:hypothetical protein [bacterium]